MRSLAVKLAVVFVLACAPISLFGIGWGLVLVSKAAPLWLFVLIGLSFVVVALGFASLLDHRSPLPPQKSRDR